MTPTQIMERLKGLPEHLQAHNRRFYVEAVSDETRAPMVEFYRRTDAANEAAQAWAKDRGADGFYPPSQAHGTGPRSVCAFSFKRENAPTDSAWVDAGRHYIPRSGYIAKRPSKRPAGKALVAELEALPQFPAYASAIDHLALIDTLRTARGFSSVGHSDGKLHFSAPFCVGERYFISAVNHNYDIAEAAAGAAATLAGDHPEWASCLDYEDDPISWRPAAGWAFLSKAEVDFIIAEENLRRAEIRKAAA
jgi:hypothetical protein